MNTKQKIMALAALPLAGLLASGGVAAAQTAGAPSGTQVVQQAVAHSTADPCPGHGTTGRCPSATVQRDRDSVGTCGSDHAPQGQATTVAHTGHGVNCDDHGDR